MVEQVSIDEAYLDMSGLHYFYSTPLEAAAKIQTEIRDALGFTVNIGISSNKLLAKMASDFEKPDKIHTLFPQEIAEKMWHLPCLLYTSCTFLSNIFCIRCNIRFF